MIKVLNQQNQTTRIRQLLSQNNLHNVLDINSPPSFTRLPLTASVFEGTEVGSSIFMPTVLDQDTMDIHSYFAVFSPPDGAIYFKINGTSMLNM